MQGCRSNRIFILAEQYQPGGHRAVNIEKQNYE